MNQQKQNGNIIAIITMFFLFAMISFVTNLAAPFGTIWKNQYAGANTLGMMGNMMNFLAYLFMGIPSGNMLVKIGYKKTALIAMAVGFIGLFIQYISSLFGADIDVFNLGEYAIKMNFIIYLLGAFVCGFCVCMLNTVVNPMLNLLGGGGNKGNQLIQAGGALNSLSGTLTPLFVGALIGSVTPQTAMSDVAPLLFIAMGVFVSAFIALSFIAIPEPHLRKAGHEKEKFSHSPWNFRHTVLGVIGIFVYVGIEIGIPGTLNFYLADPTEKGAGLLANGGVDTLICGGIGAGARLALEEAGIRLYPGAAGSADEAVRAFLAGTLSYQPDLVCSHHKDTPPRVCGSHTCSAACYHEKTEEIRNEPN